MHFIYYSRFLLYFLIIIILRFFVHVGIAPDVRQDDQIEFQGRLDHDDQNSTKQCLITSYKKNLYPGLKAEIHTSLRDPNLSTSGTLSSRSKFDLSNLRGFV